MPCGLAPAATDLSLVFPWLAETMTSDRERVVVPDENAHPLQVFWSMPRRIRLDFSHDGAIDCDLSGIADTVAVVGWRQRPYGPKYKAWGNRHPLTPKERRKGTGEWVAVRPDAAGVGYQNWVGLVVAEEDARLPAEVVTLWRDRWREAGETSGVRLLAAGFAMDRMLVAKARAFVESEMPLPGAADAAAQERLDGLAGRLVRAAALVAELLRAAVRAALFSPGATVKFDADLLASVRERLWEQTERGFFDALEHVAVGTATAEAECALWLGKLRHTALALFDEAAPLAPECGSAAPRIGRARRHLLFALTGYGKDGEALFDALEQSRAAPKAKKGKAA